MKAIKTSTIGQAIILFIAAVITFSIAGIAKYSTCSSNASFAQAAGFPTCNSMVDITFLALAFGVIFLFCAGVIFYTRRKVLSVLTEEEANTKSTTKQRQQTFCSTCGAGIQEGSGYCAKCGKPISATAVPQVQ